MPSSLDSHLGLFLFLNTEVEQGHVMAGILPVLTKTNEASRNYLKISQRLRQVHSPRLTIIRQVSDFHHG